MRFIKFAWGAGLYVLGYYIMPDALSSAILGLLLFGAGLYLMFTD